LEIGIGFYICNMFSFLVNFWLNICEFREIKWRESKSHGIPSKVIDRNLSYYDLRVQNDQCKVY
jgi:hypothetical protein